jgi:hypothetical protein
MTLAEIKDTVAHWPEAEKIHLAAYLRHLARRDDPEHCAELDNRWEAMSRGERISLTDFRQIEADLSARRL